MRLETCLLADAVASTPDGKFYIHGGGISRINPPVLPWPQALGLLLRFEMEPADADQAHQIDLMLTGPRGDTLMEMPGVQIPAITPQISEGEESFLQLAAPLGSVGFLETGLHHFTVTLDGEQVRRMPLMVHRQVEGAAQPAQPPQRPPNRAARRQSRR